MALCIFVYIYTFRIIFIYLKRYRFHIDLDVKTENSTWPEKEFLDFFLHPILEVVRNEFGATENMNFTVTCYSG